ALRLRFRNGFESGELLPPEPVDVAVRLWPTSMVFNRGHRLRVHIASSSSPALEPNLQNGLAPRKGAPQTAGLEFMFDGKLPHLVLPVVVK
ncbi:MAG TPA: CocE/NonD family hydrolase C-terminal non-catalytic domain-containing protein, partial [Verrucomicrobiae bacterium]|nr:CocE/NonD family hydrolase C-terminal non-catalytic domain-containing protein [Verrucomicrobiae bacterium]